MAAIERATKAPVSSKFLEWTLMPGIKPFTKANVPTPVEPPGPPTVNQGLIDRQAQDLARRRRGNAANVYAGSTTPGTTITPVLGGG